MRSELRLYRLYAIRLQDAVKTSKRFRDANPQGGEECVYVGSTAHSREHRFGQHMAGGRLSSKWVKRWGKGLDPDLAGSDEYETREAAEAAEAALAAKLRREGYQVWQK